MVAGEDTLGAAPNRIYETSTGPIHATFAPSVVVLARMPDDGWVRRFGRGRTAGRSPAAVVDALVGLGVPAAEAQQLGAEMAGDWQAIEIPSERSRREQFRDVVLIAAMFVRLLAVLPRFAWDILRDRGVDDESPTDFVPPGSSQYGVLRVLRTSRGWAQFEFWGGRRATAGAYRDDGWLPMATLDRELDEPGLVSALEARGLPPNEAAQTAGLVFAERRSRTGID